MRLQVLAFEVEIKEVLQHRSEGESSNDSSDEHDPCAEALEGSFAVKGAVLELWLNRAGRDSIRPGSIGIRHCRYTERESVRVEVAQLRR